MTRHGTAQEDAKQGYSDDVNKANHSCGRFAEGQPYSSSSLNILTAAPMKTGSQTGTRALTRRHCPQGPSDHPREQVMWGWGRGNRLKGGSSGRWGGGKAKGETEMASDLQEQLGWLPQGRYSNITSGEGKFHIQPPSYRPAPPARDTPVLPSIAQGPLVQA